MASILCVDDDPDMVALKKQILESAGHRVTACLSTEQAVHALTDQTFDAVVTDWRLGDGLGREVVQTAKAHASVPVIVVSGRDLQTNQKKVAALGGKAFLQKPVSNAHLLAVIRSALGERSKTEGSVVYNLGGQ